MRQYGRNILVYAVNNGNESGFNIYLDFSGQREYLFTHRHNAPMFNALKSGIPLADMQRGIQRMSLPELGNYRSGIVIKEKFLNSMRYLMTVIDEYITDREQCA